MILFHGAHTSYQAHEGQCYTADEQIAEHYAGWNGFVATVELPDDLVIEDCPGYDRDENEAPADSEAYRQAAAARGVDVLRYEDEDEMGREHACYRLVSERALGELRVLDVVEA